MITTERIAVPFSLANVPDPVCSKHFKCMQSSPQSVRWILRTCFTDKKTITLYWKTHSSSYPDEGAPWPDTGSLSQTGALCLRGGHRCTPGKAREPRLNNREAAETWLGWAGLSTADLSFQPCVPSVKGFDSSPPQKEVGGRKIKIRGHKMKKGTKQTIWREIKV